MMMSGSYGPTEEIQHKCNFHVGNSIKELLQSKHLYQSVEIDLRSIMTTVSKGHKNVPVYFMTDYPKAIESSWIAFLGTEKLRVPSEFGITKLQVKFIVPDIKIYCEGCKRIEPHDPINVNDVIEEHLLPKGKHSQSFVFLYLCQSCKTNHVTFLVNRNKHKVTLSGRIPIEHVEVPSQIPKEMKKYYSDFVVAFQSGQILAANFLTRSFVEQYVRNKSKNKNGTPEDLITEYADSLPQDFKDRFPSFSTIYGKLSEDIHAATASSIVFEESRIAIDHHFEGKVAFRIQQT